MFLFILYIDCLLSIDFDANVKQIHSSSDLTSVSQLIRSERHLAVLYMHLDYCPYCHQAAPLFSQLASATNDKIQFYAIDCEAVSCSDSLFGKVSRFPTVALIAHTSHKQFNETEQKLWVRLMPISASDPQSIQNINSLITSMTSIEFPDWQPEPFNIPIKKGKTLWMSEPQATHSPIVRRDAAISGIIKILNKFVFAGQQSIQGTRLDALRFFLEIVSSTFPSKYVRKACAQLKGDLEGSFGLNNDSVQQSRSALTFELWASSLKAQNFSKTSSEFCKTFTCELWSLFHILSLSSDRKFNTGSNKTTAAAPFKVLELSRITVDHFFYCSTCRKHYLKSYETREFNRPGTNATRDQVVLWFWNIHNAVSARASKERGYQVDSTAWPSGGQLSKSEALKAIEKAYWTDEWVENTETMTEGPIVTLILFGGITSCLLIMLFDYKTVAYSL